MSSAQSFYGPCLQSVAHSLTCCFYGNVPLLHTSRYVIPHDSVLPGLPPALVLQATNAGARRPGYEATTHIHAHTHTCTLTRAHSHTHTHIHTPHTHHTHACTCPLFIHNVSDMIRVGGVVSHCCCAQSLSPPFLPSQPTQTYPHTHHTHTTHTHTPPHTRTHIHTTHTTHNITHTHTHTHTTPTHNTHTPHTIPG